MVAGCSAWPGVMVEGFFITIFLCSTEGVSDSATPCIPSKTLWGRVPNPCFAGKVIGQIV